MSDSFLIYVVEDNDWYNKLLVHTLSLNPEFQVESFFNGKDLLDALSKRPAIITLDYRLPDTTGDILLQKIKAFDPRIEVIVISDQEDIETAVDLLKGGAYDYIIKTKDIRDKLINLINHIQNNSNLKQQLNVLQQEVQKKYHFNDTIIGTSPAIKQVFNLITKALNVNITVSISGETGTGKEVVAKAIHYNSNRKNKPFVAVNMAAIPSELIESELFGHEKGAFTGAIARRKGKFEEAQGGTIFLDEIGEIDLNFQKKLLRVLQEREVVRVGSNEALRIDCRLIIATNKDLKEEVKDGKFREDLYYRLFGLPIHLPPVRERDQDVLVLSKYFLDNFAKENGLGSKTISESARQKLLSYQWPGNVREVKSVIELAAVMAQNDEIHADDLTFSNSEDVLPEAFNEHMSLREYNRRIIDLYMKRFDNDTKKVAEALKIGQTTVYRMLKESDKQS